MLKYRFWCLVDGEADAFSVEVGVDKDIEQLKKEILTTRTHLHLDVVQVRLWKLNDPIPLGPQGTLAERSSSLNPGFFTALEEPWDKLSIYFPERPAEARLHIFVKIRADIERTGGHKPDSRWPSEEDLEKYHQMFETANLDPDWYSDPQNYDFIPFPFLHPILPDRFLLQSCHFGYMGREKFRDVYDQVSSLRLWGGYNDLYIQGTMGYGKSHILAALACLLYRQGKRVVFIPDCKAMLDAPLVYVQSALLCAFASPLLKEKRKQIRACTNQEQIYAFCHRTAGAIYYIIDQINAFERSGAIRDALSDGRKVACYTFIKSLSNGNYCISSASADYKTATYMEQKQTGVLRMSLIGGMSKDEMTQWWDHYKDKVPKFENDEAKAKVEDLTGCIPLFLQPLLLFNQQDFVEKTFRSFPDIIAIGRNVLRFAEEIRRRDERDFNSYINNLFNSITQHGALVNAECSFDYRYFYQHDVGFGVCICGLVREAATMVIAQNRKSKLYSPVWINSLCLFKDRRSALAFLVELTCLSCIADFGLNFGELHLEPTNATFFKGDLDGFLTGLGFSLDFSGFYILRGSGFEDVDALYIQYKKQTNAVTVVPIQVTISKSHKDSEWFFYRNWKKWKRAFNSYNLTTIFVWIVEKRKVWNEVNEVIMATRQKTSGMPTRKRAVIPAKCLHQHLADALARMRHL